MRGEEKSREKGEELEGLKVCSQRTVRSHGSFALVTLYCVKCFATCRNEPVHVRPRTSHTHITSFLVKPKNYMYRQELHAVFVQAFVFKSKSARHLNLFSHSLNTQAVHSTRVFLHFILNR